MVQGRHRSGPPPRIPLRLHPDSPSPKRTQARRRRPLQGRQRPGYRSPLSHAIYLSSCTVKHLINGVTWPAKLPLIRSSAAGRDIFPVDRFGIDRGVPGAAPADRCSLQGERGSFNGYYPVLRLRLPGPEGGRQSRPDRSPVCSKAARLDVSLEMLSLARLLADAIDRLPNVRSLNELLEYT